MNHVVLEIMDEIDKRSGDDLGDTLLVVMGDHGQVPFSSFHSVRVFSLCVSLRVFDMHACGKTKKGG